LHCQIKFGRQTSFCFEDVPEKTILYHVIVSNYVITYDQPKPCVSIKLPNSINEYDSILSKSTRQNIRTARNRLSKQEKAISFVFDDNIADKRLCQQIRRERLHKKRRRIRSIKDFKVLAKNFLAQKTHYEIPLIADKNSHLMTAYIDNELAAFFNYGIDVWHRTIVIMAAGTSSKFEWYSPGMLLSYLFIQNLIQNKQYSVVDFTRGDEPYKYSLGGTNRFNHLLFFSTLHQSF